MGAVFAIQVRTGQELKAKTMLCHVLEKASDRLVKSVLALETQTHILEKSNNHTVTTKPTEEEIETHLIKQEKRALITNRRRQLEAIKNYSVKMYEELKRDFLDEINELENEIKTLNTKKTKIKSVLSGYILIELRLNSERLPNYLWHLIKSVPLVQNIFEMPIPEYEMEAFAQRLDEVLEPEVEFSLADDIGEKEIEAIKIALINEFREKRRKKQLRRDDDVAIIEKFDRMRKSIMEKVYNFLNAKKKENNLFSRISINKTRNRQTVILPYKIFEKLFPNNETEFINGQVQAKDFLCRLERLSDTKGVMA